MPKPTLISTPNPLLRLSTFLPVSAMVFHACWWPKAGQKSLWHDSVTLSTLGLFSQRMSSPTVIKMSDLLLTLSRIHIISHWVILNLLLASAFRPHSSIEGMGNTSSFLSSEGRRPCSQPSCYCLPERVLSLLPDRGSPGSSCGSCCQL